MHSLHETDLARAQLHALQAFAGAVPTSSAAPRRRAPLTTPSAPPPPAPLPLPPPLPPPPQSSLSEWCQGQLSTLGYSDPNLSVCTVPAYASQITGEDCSITILEQCMTEQKYTRGAMTRTLMYAQVRIARGLVVRACRPRCLLLRLLLRV